MGFYSTICSEHYNGDLPQWLKDKYEDKILFPDGTLVVSKKGAKYYDNDFFNDYHKALTEIGFWDTAMLIVTMAVMAEDGIITKVTITKDSPSYMIMNEWFDQGHVWMQGDTFN